MAAVTNSANDSNPTSALAPQVEGLLSSHRSIRKFTDEPIDDETVTRIVKAGMAAATSSNLQGATVIRVRNPQTRARIAELAGGQTYVETAAVFLVWCADLHRAKQASALHDRPMSEGMIEHFMIATVDVGLAAQNAVVTAEAMGYGICYIGGIRNDPATVAELLELPDQVYPVFGLCIGVPAQDPQVKPRLPLTVTLKEEIYDVTNDEADIAAYDQTMADYYRKRTGGNKATTWTEEMARLVGKESRPHMLGFLNDRGLATR